jgi:diguanylate cyclase (GGDEF)-like protein
MLRLLIVDDASPIADDVARCLKEDGIEACCEVATTQSGLREALRRGPDVVLVNLDASRVPARVALSIVRSVSAATPVIALSDGSGAEPEGLAATAAACLQKGNLRNLGSTVRAVLKPAGIPIRRAKDLSLEGNASVEASGTAEQLLERRAALDKALPRNDTSAMASILRRTPPSAAALVMIDSPATRERYVKLLLNANIAVEEASETIDALACLDQRVHAVLFTDRLDFIIQARQLYAGSATHIVFVNQGGDRGASEALRAGANDVLSSEARGELFWAHLTTARRIVNLAASLQLALTDNRILSTIDELTRCGSRRFFENQFPREVERAHRLARPLALIMADIDHFKAINDTHGHQIGDEVLREFADRLTHDLRHGEDWVARVGGEEFAVVLPETNASDALRIAQRLRDHVHASPIETNAGPLGVTASFGVCSETSEHRGPNADTETFVRRADEALYASKHAGRNRVTLSGRAAGSVRGDERTQSVQIL